MASWLTHKLAQFSRSIVGGAIIVIGGTSAAVMGTYDFVSEDLDHLDGDARVQTVQAFEDQMGVISELKIDQDNLVAKREQSYLTGDMSGAKELENKIETVSAEVSNKINALDNALYLTTVIGEDDFERLATMANSKFALDASVDGAAFLHECQLKVSDTSVRDTQKETVEKCMEAEGDNDITDDQGFGIFVVSLVSLLASLGAVGGIQSSSEIRWAANEKPKPSKLLQKIQNANANRRRRRNQKKLEN